MRLSTDRTPGHLRCTLALAGLLIFGGVGTVGCGTASSPSPSPSPPPAPAPAPAATTIPSPSEAPVLAPEQRDAAFSNALTSKNLQVGEPETRTQVAESVCRSLDSGASLATLASTLQEALGGPTPENTGFIIGAATAIYCPNNLPKLNSN